MAEADTTVWHATALGFPEVEAKSPSHLCAPRPAPGDRFTDNMDDVTCTACLRALAGWGQRQGQAACGLAMDYGDDTERMLERLHEMARVDLASFHGEGGRVEMKLKTNPLLLWEMAETLSVALEGQGAANYVSWSVRHPTRGHFELIAQRAEGLRPAEVASKERARADAAEAEVARLRAELEALRG